jgi:hypothetical protein
MKLKINSSFLFTLFIVSILLYGWAMRNQSPFTAEEGLGYFFGIAGSTMMALLLLYPVRKRLRFMHGWLPVKYWFAAHMTLGVLGPTLILYHSNFGLGSLNSNVALFSMIIVSLSGLLGRYFYVRIHKGLYGRRVHLSELKQAVEKNLQKLQMNTTRLPGLLGLFDELDNIFSQATAGLLGSLKVRRQTLKITKKIGQLVKKNWTMQSFQEGRKGAVEKKYYRTIMKYILSTRRVSEYMVYESLFAWWHIIHIPLFIILIFSAIVHIIAVHMY